MSIIIPLGWEQIGDLIFFCFARISPGAFTTGGMIDV